jgi:membrane protease YdiL (CAAX protease family)
VAVTLKRETTLIRSQLPDAGAPQQGHGAPSPAQYAGPADHDPASAKSLLLSFRTGRWRWYWAILASAAGALLAVLGIIGSAVVTAGWEESAPSDALLRPGQAFDYVIVLVVWALLALAALVALRVIKGDPVRCAFTATGAFPAADFAKSAAALLLVYGAAGAATYAFTPQDFRWPERAPEFYGWLVLGLAVILVQSAAEEIFFRGFLLRVWGAVIPYPVIVCGLLMALFISIHIPNPDMQRDLYMGLSVFIGGEALAYAALLRTKTLAASMGLHWANNIFAILFLATIPLSDGAAAVFVYNDPVYLAGGTRALDPISHATHLGALVGLVVLLFYKGSPLCLSRRAVQVPANARPKSPPSRLWSRRRADLLRQSTV